MDPFAKRRLGSTAVEVTSFGFGGAPLGERFVRVDNATADAIVEAAFAAGIT
jgi:D-threo-aldose 1-dehydrogenase